MLACYFLTVQYNSLGKDLLAYSFSSEALSPAKNDFEMVTAVQTTINFY